MKISGWEAYLSNGAVLNESFKVGEVIDWVGKHWDGADNQMEVIRVETTEENGFITGRAVLKGKKLSWQQMMSFSENDALKIRVKPDRKPDEILALYMFSDWWTRPAFCKDFREIPENTNLVLTRTGDTYTGYLALPGNTFKARFSPCEEADALQVVLSSYRSGYASIEEDVFLAVKDSDPYHCPERLMKEAAARAGIADRRHRKYPEIFEKIGWCSWDAFYRELYKDKVLEKMQEIREKKIPFGWILLDDGWHCTEEERLQKMSADPVKFPDNLKSAVQKIKEITNAGHVGVWHAFAGYWGGIDEGSEIYEQEKENLIPTVQGRWIPAPDREKAYHFYSDWHRYLKEQGIDFIKVDSQATMITHYKGNAAIGTAARQLHQALDQSAEAHMDGCLINCMGMAAENVLSRPISGISRNSDDFFPLKENGFEEHLLENAYNSLYHSVLYHGDWDMFWSSHPDAEKHAIIRALSGGPIYVSDKIGESDPEVLDRLCYKDGTILRAQNAAVPTKDCIFRNPEKCGYLKIRNECNGVGYLAIFNYSEEAVQVPWSVSDVLSADVGTAAGCRKENGIDGMPQYAVYGRIGKTFAVMTADELQKCVLEKKGYELYLIAPICEGAAVFGLADKYLSSHAIESVVHKEDVSEISVKENGALLVYSKRTPENWLINGDCAKAVHKVCNGFWRIEI